MYMISKDEKFKINIEMADSFLKRFCGLMMREGISEDMALILKPCSSVHSCFMKFNICVLYLDENYTLLGKEILRPWKTGKIFRGTKIVVEMNEKVGNELKIGDNFYLLS